MTLLWINLCIVFLFALFARYFATPIMASEIGSLTIKPNRLLILGSLSSLVLISGLRQGIGDTFVYRKSFENKEFTWELISADKDIGFGILQMFLKNYVSQDSQVLIFTAALLTNVIIISVLFHYSRMIELSLYVYITGGLFLVSMNGIRQLLAAAIAFAAIKFLIEGNLIRYALIIVVASLFHQSALILLPIYFFVRFKAWSTATVSLIIFSVIIVFGYEQFSSILFTALEDTQYSGYVDFNEGGANIVRVAVEAAPLAVAYLGRKKLRHIFPKSDVIVNMALVGFVFMAISTNQWIFARVSIYFQLYSLILISWLPKLFKEKDQKLIYFIIIICYLAYYYYESVIALNINYTSDYFIW
ncbi:EpsG family protein [Oceanobacillus piezotolerans]|uniref:EpsG family protein n=1 Tax=Oceanobacillus piezotolerans TaxID=2448030 RepID=A0A498D471_9BACI|nr:EpsG family protein [Oceanobacillus piezotolerans]RLL42759.1 EpsG family protein [Oceanobacillus piezotolerans]